MTSLRAQHRLRAAPRDRQCYSGKICAEGYPLGRDSPCPITLPDTIATDVIVATGLRGVSRLPP